MTNDEELEVFVRQVRNRSREHSEAMQLLAQAGLAGQMVAVLRQELDSMVRVIFLLSQSPERRSALIGSAISGTQWTQVGSRSRITDREMVDLADRLHGWTRSVYKFGCAFIHLSNLHDYNDRDPLSAVSDNDRNDILEHIRHYHGGPPNGQESFSDLVPYFPRILDKISGNLECYLAQLEEGEVPPPFQI